MADIKLNPVFEGINRKIGDLVFFKMNGRTFVKRLGEHNDAKSPEQIEVRNAFTQMVENWKQLKGIFRESWKSYAKTKPRGTGYNHFIGVNSGRQRNGEPLVLFKSLGEESTLMIESQPGTNPGEITLYFTPTPTATDKHLTVFCQRVLNEEGADPFIRYDLGTNVSSPVTIDNIEGGQDYFVYAIITDNVYDEATTVSDSAASRVTVS